VKKAKKMIGLSSSYYAVRGFSIFDSIRKIVELGFSVVELGAAHSYEEDIWGTLKKAKNEFPEIKFTIHALFPPLKQRFWFNPADGLQAMNLNVINNLFKAADVMQSEIISIHSPVINEMQMEDDKVGGGFYKDSAGIARDLSLCRSSFLEVIDYMNTKAQKAGIKVGIENMNHNHFNTFLQSSDDFLRIFSKYPNFGLLLDVPHAILAGNLDVFQCIKDKILELHLHEIGEDKNSERFGHFAIRNLDYFERIKEFIVQVDGPIIFEHGNDVSEEEILCEMSLLDSCLEKDCLRLNL
jgi:sugar phosphate isomerase/epimerase